MAKTRSEAVAKAQAKVVEAGGARVTLTLQPDEATDWRALVALYPRGRGQQKAAFMGAVRSKLAGGAPTPEEALEVLRRAVAR